MYNLTAFHVVHVNETNTVNYRTVIVDSNSQQKNSQILQQ